MKTIDTRPDLDIAPARITFAIFAKALGVRLLVLLRALRNRREVMNLEDFTEDQLADIGLTREDVDRSLATPWYADPSTQLTRSAWQRRSHLRRLG
ncbi:DUF1127 domain-containing protein [Pararhizobium haloflavum]|uniref:DUF1127 domain-containing protein n=1 Tax=Pararhizobium haloflavum TaxID=2037914 RepID=UPI000C186861|nr:DUF1127 domain-containing protein [Pararhizobium haloflavum]